MAASLNLLHHSKDLPFIHLREDPVAPIARADSELKCGSNSTSVSCACFVELQAAVCVFLCLLQEPGGFSFVSSVAEIHKMLQSCARNVKGKAVVKGYVDIKHYKTQGRGTSCSLRVSVQEEWN